MGVRSLYYRLTGAKRWREVRRNGIDYRVRYVDEHGRDILQHGMLEPEQTRVLTDIAKSNEFDGFIDIGSGFGFHAVWLSMNAEIGHTWAFEADPETFQMLADHVKRNGLSDRIESHNLTLSGNTPAFQFHRTDDSRQSPSEVRGDDTSPAPSEDQTVKVNAKPLDSAIELTNHRLLLKVDVKGQELAVLQGARHLLARNAAFLQVESVEQNSQPVEEFLGSIGYCYLKTVGDNHYFSNCDVTL